MKKKFLQFQIIVMAILLFVPCLKIGAIEIPKYNPYSPVLFVSEMRRMLQQSPLAAFNSALILDGFHSKGSESNKIDEGNAFNNGSFAFIADAIIPIKLVNWLAISGNFIGVFDFFDPSNGADGVIEVTSDNGALNIYANIGIVCDFAPVTLGFFGGYYTDIMGQSQTTASISDMESEPKFLFIPIVKTGGWLSFLNTIASYINFGKASGVDFGQSFNFFPLQVAGNPLIINAYYNNERYSSYARYWSYGAEVKYGKAYYVVINAGYRNFYDFPSEADVEDSFIAKLNLGWDAGNGNFGVMFSGTYDYLGMGIGLGLHWGILEGYTEIVFKDTDFNVNAFKLGIRFSKFGKR